MINISYVFLWNHMEFYPIVYDFLLAALYYNPYCYRQELIFVKNQLKV